MRTFKITILILAVAVFAAFTKSQNTSNANKEGYKVGDLATDFSLKNVDGKLVSLSDFKDAKGFIVIFTCNTCPYAVANQDRIIALDKQYKSKGYPVIAINPNNPEVQPGDSFEAMQQRAREKGFTFPYLLDEGQKIYPQYGASKTPEVYILQKEAAGLRVKYTGAVDDSSRDPNAVTEKYVENAVNELLAGKPVTVSQTRAIGCAIKA
ncbi:MAG: thioredoxin family protein [Flavobacteriaceae bacterium]|nr:thioredoxin family protein [Flavobacteriaceae bacterium]